MLPVYTELVGFTGGTLQYSAGFSSKPAIPVEVGGAKAPVSPVSFTNPLSLPLPLSLPALMTLLMCPTCV